MMLGFRRLHYSAIRQGTAPRYQTSPFWASVARQWRTGVFEVLVVEGGSV